jgi:hypothetical protein
MPSLLPGEMMASKQNLVAKNTLWIREKFQFTKLS